MSKTTLYLETELYKAIRHTALEDGVAVSHLFDQLAREYLAKRNQSELAYALGSEPQRSRGPRGELSPLGAVIPDLAKVPVAAKDEPKRRALVNELKNIDRRTNALSRRVRAVALRFARLRT